MFVTGKDFEVKGADGRAGRFVIQESGDEFVAPASRRADLVRVEPGWTSDVVDPLRNENFMQATLLRLGSKDLVVDFEDEFIGEAAVRLVEVAAVLVVALVVLGFDGAGRSCRERRGSELHYEAVDLVLVHTRAPPPRSSHGCTVLTLSSEFRSLADSIHVGKAARVCVGNLSALRVQQAVRAIRVRWTGLATSEV